MGLPLSPPPLEVSILPLCIKHICLPPDYSLNACPPHCCCTPAPSRHSSGPQRGWISPARMSGLTPPGREQDLLLPISQPTARSGKETLARRSCQSPEHVGSWPVAPIYTPPATDPAGSAVPGQASDMALRVSAGDRRWHSLVYLMGDSTGPGSG